MTPNYELTADEKRKRKEVNDTTIKRGFRLAGKDKQIADVYLFLSVVVWLMSMAYLKLDDIYTGAFFGFTSLFLFVMVNGAVLHHKANYIYLMCGGDQRAEALKRENTPIREVKK